MHNTWKFSELKLAKTDLRVYMDIFEDATRRIEEATDGADVVQIILELDEMTRRADDLVRLAHIRSTIDTKDPVYQEQLAWLGENMIYYDQAVMDFKDAVYNSRFREYLEGVLGSAYFISADIERQTFSEDCIGLYQKEVELYTEYLTIMGSAEVDILGEKRNIAQLKLLFTHDDREVRRSAFKALSQVLEENESRLEELWGELIKVRDEHGKKLGYNNFIPVGYLHNQHIHYSPADIEVFRKQVVEEIVPLCEKIYEAQRKRLGVDEFMSYDEKAVFYGGTARRIGDDEYVIEKARAMYNDISQEAGEFIDYMLTHELFEYKERPGKEAGGYGTMLLSYKAPFVFTHFDGSIADFNVITRDLGEAFVRYKASRTQPIKEYYSATSDVMEIYALSMDQFADSYVEDFFGDDADKYRLYSLQDIITFIPIGCAVDEFQHICYENTDLTPKERALEWRKLEKKYMPWRKYDNDEFMERGGYFYSIQHIFVYPFYYIDYALARVHALEMKKKYAVHPEVTWQNYMDLIAQGGRVGYAEVVNKLGLTPLFQDGAVAKATSYAKAVMNEYIEKL